MWKSWDTECAHFQLTRNSQMDLQSVWEFPYVLTEPYCQTFRFAQSWEKSTLTLVQLHLLILQEFEHLFCLLGIWVFLLQNTFFLIAYAHFPFGFLFMFFIYSVSWSLTFMLQVPSPSLVPFFLNCVVSFNIEVFFQFWRTKPINLYSW